MVAIGNVLDVVYFDINRHLLKSLKTVALEPDKRITQTDIIVRTSNVLPEGSESDRGYITCSLQ